MQQEIDHAEYRFFETIQKLLATGAIQTGRKEKFRTICGVDAAYSDSVVIAVASTFDSASGELLEQSIYRGKATFPYIPGLFFLREGPFATEAVLSLKKRPDLACFDAHGMAHPRHLGLATICGMVLNIPSIGIAKSRLAGKLEPYKLRLDKLIEDGGEKQIGFVTNSQDRKRRYWSPGYSVSISALEQIIENYVDTCVKSITASHQSSKESIIATDFQK